MGPVELALGLLLGVVAAGFAYLMPRVYATIYRR